MKLFIFIPKTLAALPGFSLNYTESHGLNFFNNIYGGIIFQNKLEFT